MTSSGHFTFLLITFDRKRDRDMGKVPKCSSHQDGSADMQHDLLRSLVDLDLRWSEVKFTN